ncbi:MAG: hypothetical protein QM764_21705 [Chitinophagaceae bacterium]
MTKPPQIKLSGITIPQVIFILFSGIISLVNPAIYGAESANWRLQSRVQDLINCTVLVPVLLLSFYLARRGSYRACNIWGGANIYLVYTYFIYCFDLHFNPFFLMYCIILGLSFYSTALFFYQQITGGTLPAGSQKRGAKAAGLFFIIISLLFSIAWIGNILPAMLHAEPPAEIIDANIPTNPVHVLDLSIFLPGIFLTGVLLLKADATATKLAPAISVFISLMSITIAGLLISRETTILFNAAGAAVLLLIAVVSCVLFIRLQYFILQ